MDVYSGYNQIKMHPMDENKMTFILGQPNYYYKVMFFGLKNVGATYQRLMDKIPTNLIGRNVEAYIDCNTLRVLP